MEPVSVQITRLVCQLVLGIAVLVTSLVLLLTHPEYSAGAALAVGVVLGSGFGLVRPHYPRRRDDANGG